LKPFRELKTESLGTISVVNYNKKRLVFLRGYKGENLKVIRHLNLNPLIAYVQISGVLLKGVKLLGLFEEISAQSQDESHLPDQDCERPLTEERHSQEWYKCH
jgi:hypothetical protein